MAVKPQEVLRIVAEEQVPPDWHRATVQELLDEGSLALVQDGNHGGAYPKADAFASYGIPLITGADLSDGGIDLRNCQFLKPENAARLRIGFAKKGDVLLTHKGTMGKTAIIPDISTPYIILNPQLTLYRVSPGGRLRARFLKYFFDSDLFQGFLHRISGISTISTLSLTVQKSLELCFPTSGAQDAIANILGALDDKIELNRRMNETLEGLARAIFQSWFVDFDPVRAQRDGLPPPALSPTTAALFPNSFEDSELGKIPKGWRVGVLEEVLSVIETGSRPKGGVGGISFGVPSIGAESIVGLGKFNFGKTKYVPVEFFDAMRKGHVESRDVLLYKDGGRPGEYEPHVAMFGDGFPFERSCINEHVYRLRANERLSQTLLYFWMTSEVALDEMRRKGTGVAIPGLNSTAVKSLTTLIPSREVVASFNQAAESFVGRILSNCNESRTLAAIRDSLLPKLLSGEIRVEQ